MLYILCGIPFSGKTTFARKLAKQKGYTHIDLDEVKFKLMGPDTADHLISQDDWDKIYKEIYAQIDSALSKNQTVVYDTGNFTRHERGLVSSIAIKRHTTFKTIFVDTPIAVARQRLAINRKQPDRFNITDEEFESAVQEMETPSSNEHVFVYDGAQPIQEWLDINHL
ncbi:MAG: ATP-binding protein [bacterium]